MLQLFGIDLLSRFNSFVSVLGFVPTRKVSQRCMFLVITGGVPTKDCSLCQVRKANSGTWGTNL